MTLKDLLGKIPYSAELYDVLHPGRPRTRYNLSQLEEALPAAVAQLRPVLGTPPSGRRIVLFATLHYWVEQAAIIGLTLRGLGHDVSVAYLPYGDWRKPVPAFDLRRQDLYTRRVLSPVKDLLRTVSLLDIKPAEALPTRLSEAVEKASAFDTMYTLQVEDFDKNSALYRLRVERNRAAALSALAYLQNEQTDTVLIPNGLVTELGIFYQVARHLGLMTVTYEFNDQREQIWLSQNNIVMQQNTDALWSARGSIPLTNSEREQIAGLENARTSAGKYGKGTRFWQDVASVGGEAQRAALGLDARPVALLATNVLGDSLTLGRNIFTASMAEWITKTVQYFATRPDVQLVVRVHPGERLMKGPSSLDVIKAALPEISENIKLIAPLEKVNTYDLMEIAGLGLAYTTTVGMEMAMRGVPVILAGQTHYRGRGFTHDPTSWEEYFATADRLLADLPAHRLAPEQVERAWNYAYRFFFNFPMPFPWRLMHFWKDLQEWSIARVLSDEGRVEFGKTFDALSGQPLDWVE
ncbi:MAG TPA: hypothetical protein VGK00_05715 [Anaerolineales bacterium]|jgi:hypothetical protein